MLDKLTQIVQMPTTAEGCTFCKIISKEIPGEIEFEDDEIVVFKDIKPASKHHYLAVPKDHIPNVNSLTLDHKALVEKLVANGKAVLEEKGGDINDLVLGFHVPPFNSISHVHLHIISPRNGMSFLNSYIYRPNSYWFQSVEKTIEELQSKL